MRDFQEWIRAVKEIGEKVDIEVWLPVLLAAVAVAALTGWHARRLFVSLTGRGRAEAKTDTQAVCGLDAELLKALESEDTELWNLRSSEVPRGLIDRIHHQRLRVVTLANLKGGVGKTTMTANLAAYFAESGKRVVLIDFDYQGSLTAAVLGAAGRLPYSDADKLISGKFESVNLVDPARNILPNLWLVPAQYALNRQETRMLMRWLLQQGEPDPRFVLARLLAGLDELAPDRRPDLVLIDTPPRLGLATVNALCASTHVIIPTNLDAAAVENIQTLVGQLKTWFRGELNPRIELAGIIGTMTLQALPDKTERASRLTAEQAAQSKWGARAGGIEALQALEEWPQNAYVLKQTVPDTVRFKQDAGRTIAYLDRLKSNEDTRSVIARLGRELAGRIDL